MKIAKKTGIREMPVFAKFVKDSDLYYKGEKVRKKIIRDWSCKRGRIFSEKKFI